VRERLALTSKGEAVDVLVLSATPIPRTLVLTYFGDMDVSELREKPAGRQPIDTRAMPLGRLEEVMDGVGRALKSNKRVYWICPLVEESEAEGTEHLTNATKRFESLQKRFGDAVGLVHGQMKGAEKDRVMAQFASGEIGLLVATTVVEVGVDVPAASIMVIENAERFGLAQLHQLRGRIGRGSEASTCLLLYKEPLNEMSTARLKVIRETNDGFGSTNIESREKFGLEAGRVEVLRKNILSLAYGCDGTLERLADIGQPFYQRRVVRREFALPKEERIFQARAGVAAHRDGNRG